MGEGQMRWYFDIECALQGEWSCLFPFRIDDIPLKESELGDVFSWFKLLKFFLGGAIFALQIAAAVFTAPAFRFEVVLHCWSMVG